LKKIEDATGGASSKNVDGAMRPLCAPRANRVFRADEKHIRTENTVMYKKAGQPGLFLSTILDCARIRFSSVRNRGSARTGRRPRKLRRQSSKYRPMSADIVTRALRALRANRDFGTDIKRIRTKITVMDKRKGGFRMAFFCTIIAYRHRIQ